MGDEPLVDVRAPTFRLTGQEEIRQAAKAVFGVRFLSRPADPELLKRLGNRVRIVYVGVLCVEIRQRSLNTFPPAWVFVVS